MNTKQRDNILRTALQRYLVDKRIEAAHNKEVDSAKYSTLLSGIETLMDEMEIDRDDATLEAIRQQRPGCHHA